MMDGDGWVSSSSILMGWLCSTGVSYHPSPPNSLIPTQAANFNLETWQIPLQPPPRPSDPQPPHTRHPYLVPLHQRTPSPNPRHRRSQTSQQGNQPSRPRPARRPIRHPTPGGTTLHSPGVPRTCRRKATLHGSGVRAGRHGRHYGPRGIPPRDLEGPALDHLAPILENEIQPVFLAIPALLSGCNPLATRARPPPVSGADLSALRRTTPRTLTLRRKQSREADVTHRDPPATPTPLPIPHLLIRRLHRLENVEPHRDVRERITQRQQVIRVFRLRRPGARRGAGVRVFRAVLSRGPRGFAGPGARGWLRVGVGLEGLYDVASVAADRLGVVKVQAGSCTRCAEVARRPRFRLSPSLSPSLSFQLRPCPHSRPRARLLTYPKIPIRGDPSPILPRQQPPPPRITIIPNHHRAPHLPHLPHLPPLNRWLRGLFPLPRPSLPESPDAKKRRLLAPTRGRVSVDGLAGDRFASGARPAAAGARKGLSLPGAVPRPAPAADVAVEVPPCPVHISLASGGMSRFICSSS